MELAHKVAEPSKDSTRVGAILSTPEGANILTGYNGPPMGVNDTPDRFERPRKYLFASHAEQNIIAFAARNGIRTAGCTLTVTHHPCSSCARSIIHAGIKCVVVGDGKTSMLDEEFEAAAIMFQEAGIEIVRDAQQVNAQHSSAPLESVLEWRIHDDRWIITTNEKFSIFRSLLGGYVLFNGTKKQFAHENLDECKREAERLNKLPI